LVATALHELDDRLRALVEADLPQARLNELADACGRAWAARAQLAPIVNDPDVREDITELATAHARWLAQRAGPDGAMAARRAALSVLDEATALVGPSLSLDLAKYSHALALGEAQEPGPDWQPKNAHDQAALGRFFLHRGRFAEAHAALLAAVTEQPQAFWSQFYRGVAAFRLGWANEAVMAFSICEALSPRTAACVYNRGLALEQLGRREEALRDFARALELDPSLAAAALHQSTLLLADDDPRPHEALAALDRAAAAGADGYEVALQRARAHDRLGDEANARFWLDRALTARPGDPVATALRDRWMSHRP
jgi:tetratricopeptide (TPR) repeat protein